MCSRTIIEIENCKSNPRFETVALIAEEMNISLDGIVFHDKVSQTVPKCVVDFFANKSEADAQPIGLRIIGPASMRPALILLFNFNHDNHRLQNPLHHRGQPYHQCGNSNHYTNR